MTFCVLPMLVKPFKKGGLTLKGRGVKSQVVAAF